MSNELYRISSCREETGSIICTISFNKAHGIFGGHFPGNPIVPGVCTMQMVLELLQKAVQKKLRLISASNIKFLQLITPDVTPIASITWSASDTAYTANAILKNGAVTLFKMNGTYAVVD